MKAVLVLETVHVSALNRRVKCLALCVGPLSAWTGRSTARSMATRGARIRARRPRRAAAAVSLPLAGTLLSASETSGAAASHSVAAAACEGLPQHRTPLSAFRAPL